MSAPDLGSILRQRRLHLEAVREAEEAIKKARRSYIINTYIVPTLCGLIGCFIGSYLYRVFT